jgi:tetratricopeptide (TPR) repeat protein
MKKSSASWKTLNARAREKKTEMCGGSRFVSVVLIFLLVFLGWAGNSTAHRRGGLPLVRPAPEPAGPGPASPSENTSGPLSLTPEVFWQKLLAQEQAGEIGKARQTGLALVNLFPQAPRLGAALLKAAELAAGQGHTAQALELYSLAACLVPGTPEAAQADLQAAVLELSRDLSRGDPLPTLRHFLERVTALPSGYAPETLQEALNTGWQAVCQQARGADPPPLNLVENILTLWDLQPQGLGPPEAARLLADLLQEYGLLEEAQRLTQAVRKTDADRHSRLQAPGLKLACLSRGWPGIADFLDLLPPGEKHQKFLLRAWLARWRAGVGSAGLPFEALPAVLLPSSYSAGWQVQVSALEPNLQPEHAAPWAERLQAGLALTFWAEAQFSPAAQIYKPMSDQSLRAASGPFYQDRLGLRHLKNGEIDAAQQTFQNLAQHNDPFWRRLARVRLTDLELSRLQAEPSP